MPKKTFLTQNGEKFCKRVANAFFPKGLLTLTARRSAHDSSPNWLRSPKLPKVNRFRKRKQVAWSGRKDCFPRPDHQTSWFSRCFRPPGRVGRVGCATEGYPKAKGFSRPSASASSDALACSASAAFPPVAKERRQGLPASPASSAFPVVEITAHPWSIRHTRRRPRRRH
jgi:hypothetical protein